jgi:pyruvate,orthophosphate dikinase
MMIPLVATKRELELMKEVVDSTAKAVFARAPARPSTISSAR